MRSWLRDVAAVEQISVRNPPVASPEKRHANPKKRYVAMNSRCGLVPGHDRNTSPGIARDRRNLTDGRKP
jgi:hypothetical protein